MIMMNISISTRTIKNPWAQAHGFVSILHKSLIVRNAYQALAQGGTFLFAPDQITDC